MLRFMFVALSVVGCQHHAAPAPENRPCPAIAITRGTCALPSPAPTECHGVCGVVVQTGSCAPVRDALLRVNQVIASTDENGRFELAALPAGHYRIVVSSGPEMGAVELDVSGSPEVLPQPLEVPPISNQGCGCGGPCPT